MARPRTPVKRDPAPVIAARVRMLPADQSVVLSKMSDGTVVKCLRSEIFSIGKSSEGQEVIVTKEGPAIQLPNGKLAPRSLDTDVERYDMLLPSEVSRKLKAGAAQEWSYAWFNENPKRLAEVRASYYEPVKKANNEVYCPYAYGLETDDLWHMGDTILCKRPVERSRMERHDLDYYNNPARFFESQKAGLEDMAGHAGVKDFEQNIEAADNDAVTMGQQE